MTDTESSAPPQHTTSPCRKILKGLAQWLLALIVIPLLFIFLLEIGLRVANTGIDNHYFTKQEVRGETYCEPNYNYFGLYFGKHIERVAWTCGFPEKKSPNTYRIFVLGASAAFGEPEQHSGMAHHLETMLAAAYPNAMFEVRNFSVAGINSHIIRNIAKECAQYSPDVIIVYMGNNEVIGPFGACTPIQATWLGRFITRPAVYFETLRCTQLMERVYGRCFLNNSWLPYTSDMPYFLDHQVTETDPRLFRTYHHFRNNLSDIIESGANQGATVLVSSVATNLRDCAPFASSHKSGLSEQSLARWEDAWKQGIQSIENDQNEAAVSAFREALNIDDQYAELHYRLGQALYKTGQYEPAYEAFTRARDLDTLRFRADSQINQIIQEVTGGYASRGAVFVDGVAAIREESPNQIPGEEHFYDHVHFSPEGNYVLAAALYKAMTPKLPEWVHAHTGKTSEPPDRELVWKLLPLTEWNHKQHYESLLDRVANPPFERQPGARMRLNRLRAQMNQSLAFMNDPAHYRDMDENFKQAVEMRPNDYLVLETCCEFLFQSQKYIASEEFSRRLIEKQPRYVFGIAHIILGDALLEQKKAAEAIPFFEQAVALQSPGGMNPLNALGDALLQAGRREEAMQTFEKCLEIAKDHGNLAQEANFLKKLGKEEEAEKIYRRIIALAPEISYYWEALYPLLAKRLSKQGLIEAYQELSRQYPKSMWGFIGLGDALRADEKNQEAISAFEQAAENNEQDALPFLEIAQIHEESKNWEAAIAVQEKAAEREPGNYFLRVKLAEYHETQGDKVKCAEALLSAAKVNPADTGLLARLNQKLIELDNLPQRIKIWREFSEKFPGLGVPQYALGIALLNQNTPENDASAEEAFRKAIALEPAFQPAYDALLAVLDKRLSPEDFQKAFDELKAEFQKHAVPQPEIPQDDSQSTPEGAAKDNKDS
ncbi:MAG TPA: tetratricopeptide repeat protein [Candidatus Hydrogenedentes bacterium]|nr:tetratricopeptide repeat protein [Candidatus Hydrogenedentota bacterium]